MARTTKINNNCINISMTHYQPHHHHWPDDHPNASQHLEKNPNHLPAVDSPPGRLFPVRIGAYIGLVSPFLPFSLNQPKDRKHHLYDQKYEYPVDSARIWDLHIGQCDDRNRRSNHYPPGRDIKPFSIRQIPE